MGNCCGSLRNDIPLTNVNIASEHGSILSTGNRPLLPFKSYIPKENETFSEIAKKRQIFWDTEPTYSGRIEIWQTLRMACESDSIETSQAIVDSACLSFPSGKFTDGCYDTFGNQYVIPDYCLGYIEIKAEKSKIETENEQSLYELNIEKQFEITVRLNTGSDIKLIIDPSISILMIKHLILKQVESSLTPKSVMIIHLGKVYEDSVRVEQTPLDGTTLIQAMIIQNV